MAERALSIPRFDADNHRYDHGLSGSDYPLPEGLADPVSYVDELEGLDEESIGRITGGSLATLMNVVDAVAR